VISALESRNPHFPNADRKTLILFLLAFYTAWTIRVVALMPVDAAIKPIGWQTLWGQSLRILLWGVPVWWMLARFHNVNAVGALALDRFPKGKALALTAAVSIGWILVTALHGGVVEGKSVILVTSHPSVKEWAVILLTIAWAPVFEEILFRGYVHQALRAYHGWIAAGLISAVLFAVAHWPGWLYMQGLHSGLIAQTVSVAIIGFVLSAVFETGKSLWPCIIVHTLNNLLWAG